MNHHDFRENNFSQNDLLFSSNEAIWACFAAGTYSSSFRSFDTELMFGRVFDEFECSDPDDVFWGLISPLTDSIYK